VTVLTKTSSNYELWSKIGLILSSGLLYAITIASVGVAADYIPPFTLTAMRGYCLRCFAPSFLPPPG
jgi:hypothetical protein